MNRFLLPMFLFYSQISFSDVNNNYLLIVKGVVNERTCSINNEDVYQDIDFGSVNLFKIKREGRGEGKEIKIRLYDCNVNLVKFAELKLVGDEDETTQGGLMVKGNAKGLGIGFEDKYGKRININKDTVSFNVNSEMEAIVLYSYLYAGRDNLWVGDFYSSVNFLIDYI